MLSMDRHTFMSTPHLDIPYIVWLEDHNGGSVRCDAYDTAEELLRDWPHAVKISAREFEAWIGGGR